MCSDTTPDVEERQIEGLRRLTPARRLALAGELTLAVRQLALAGLRQRYPAATPTMLRRRLADLLLGPEMAARVYGPLTEGPC
jgi:hypothetical protein